MVKELYFAKINVMINEHAAISAESAEWCHFLKKLDFIQNFALVDVQSSWFGFQFKNKYHTTCCWHVFAISI